MLEKLEMKHDFTILEFHTNLDLEGFEDKDMETGEIRQE